MSSALKSQELAEELVDPKAFGKSGEAWVFAQVATIALYLVPLPCRSCCVLHAAGAVCRDAMEANFYTARGCRLYKAPLGAAWLYGSGSGFTPGFT